MISKLLKDIYDNNIHSKLMDDELLEQSYLIELQLLSIFNSCDDSKTFIEHPASTFYFRDKQILFELIAAGNQSFARICDNFKELYHIDYNIVQLKPIIEKSLTKSLNHTTPIRILINMVGDSTVKNEKWEKIIKSVYNIESEFDNAFIKLWNECDSIGYNKNDPNRRYFVKDNLIWFNLFIDSYKLIINIYNTPFKKLKNQFNLDVDEISKLFNEKFTQMFNKTEFPNIIVEAFDTDIYNCNIFKIHIRQDLQDTATSIQFDRRGNKLFASDMRYEKYETFNDKVLRASKNTLHYKFSNEYNLLESDINLLLRDINNAVYFNEICKHTSQYKTALDWMNNPIKQHLNENKISIDQFPIRPIRIAELINAVHENKTTYETAKNKIFPILLGNKINNVNEIAKENNLFKITDITKIQQIIDNIILNNISHIEYYKKSDNLNVNQFIMNLISMNTDNRIDIKLLNELLDNKLKQSAQ
jgi:hypothetical protein